MKKIFKIDLVIFCLLIVSSLAFAHVQNKSKLPFCPSTKIIKTIAFDEIQKGDHPGVWTFVQNNQTYNTAKHWNFSLMIDAETQNAAVKKAKFALAHLRKIRGPEKVDAVWVCDYEGKSSLSAVAVSR